MHHTARILLLISGIACTVTLLACDLLDPSPEPTIVEPEVVDCDDTESLDGLEIYRCECASCHGIDGIPESPNITDIRGWDDRPLFERSLNNGPAGMPRYPGLDQAARTRLFEYLRDQLGR